MFNHLQLAFGLQSIVITDFGVKIFLLADASHLLLFTCVLATLTNLFHHGCVYLEIVFIVLYTFSVEDD